jgi:hypothetical protein
MASIILSSRCFHTGSEGLTILRHTKTCQEKTVNSRQQTAGASCSCFLLLPEIKKLKFIGQDKIKDHTMIVEVGPDKGGDKQASIVPQFR